MILITGGLGFIGTHTTRALLDLGESCLLVQRRPAVVPEAFAGEPVVVEQADLTEESSLLELGKRHEITGIVHLAGSVPWPPGAYQPLEGAEQAVRSLMNVFRAASEWQVARVGVASTIGVYGGVPGEGALKEDVPLPMTAGHPIPAFKKIGELLGDHLAGAMGLDVVNYRIAAIWGPLGHTPSPFFAAPQLVHAAARGAEPDLSTLRAGAHLGDGIDMCYVKDCGRAIALLQLADRLAHRTYNVASGRLTTNGEVVAAIRKLVPDARADLPEGRDPAAPGFWLDTTRLREDTGYEPAYDTERAVADYLAWLRAGNER
ncbi:NAD-dependent epimerase/dehydratase family protein [Nonomuraea sp. NPDC049400]|uniref:NAD-dependent epimerase/dehydratase family protein n=1 Tax=Nonomuraea sp. NPDC049400 TaxID=3364352 RepID=UPI0037877797